MSALVLISILITLFVFPGKLIEFESIYTQCIIFIQCIYACIQINKIYTACKKHIDEPLFLHECSTKKINDIDGIR